MSRQTAGAGSDTICICPCFASSCKLTAAAATEPAATENDAIRIDLMQRESCLPRNEGQLSGVAG